MILRRLCLLLFVTLGRIVAAFLSCFRSRGHGFFISSNCWPPIARSHHFMPISPVDGTVNQTVEQVVLRLYQLASTEFRSGQFQAHRSSPNAFVVVYQTGNASIPSGSRIFPVLLRQGLHIVERPSGGFRAVLERLSLSPRAQHQARRDFALGWKSVL